MERLRCHTKGGKLGEGVPLQDYKFELSPPVGYHSQSPFPPLITDHTLEKVFVIAFRQILPKILPAVYIFSNTIIINLKKLIGKKFLNTKQCPAGLSPRIIPLNLYGKARGWGKIPANSQKFTNFPLQKNPFHLITLYKLHL